MDELTLIDAAIDDTIAGLALNDPKLTGGLATALVKLFTYRRQLDPWTLDEFVQMTADFMERSGLGVDDLYRGLADRVAKG